MFESRVHPSLPALTGPLSRLAGRYLEFGPILVFAGLGSLENLSTPDRFLIGGGLAAAVLLSRLLGTKRSNSLALGADLFMILGSCAWLCHFEPLMHGMQAMEESGLFATLLLVGLARTLITPGGFIDEPDADPSAVTRGSAMLMAAGGMALSLSLLVSGPEWLAAGLPFVLLLLLQSLLKRRYGEIQSKGSSN